MIEATKATATTVHIAPVVSGVQGSVALGNACSYDADQGDAVDDMEPYDLVPRPVICVDLMELAAVLLGRGGEVDGSATSPKDVLVQIARMPTAANARRFGAR